VGDSPALRCSPCRSSCTRTAATTYLLIRRNIADGDLAFFSTSCPAGTGIEMLVEIEGHRWAIEDSFETAKNELGLDHNETRSWCGWHRHASLVMLAFHDGRHSASRKHRDAPKRMRRTMDTSRRR
jgi:SRSO17 transposase